ncbi:MAG: cytochrome c biogenesis protein CcdA [Planctomycetota bacterium]
MGFLFGTLVHNERASNQSAASLKQSDRDLSGLIRFQVVSLFMKHLSAILMVFLFAGILGAQIGETKEVEISKAIFEPDGVEAGGTADLVVSVMMAPGWHIYSNEEHSAQFATTFEVTTDGASFAGPVKEPKPHKVMQSWGDTNYWHEGVATFRIPVKFDAKLKGKLSIRFVMAYMACNASGCLPDDTLKFSAAITIGGSSSGAAGAGGQLPGPLGRTLLNKLNEIIENNAKANEKIIDLEEALEELKPKPPELPPEAPVWKLTDVVVNMNANKVRASKSVSGTIKFKTGEKAKLESLSEIFIDESTGSKRVSEIVATAVRSDETGMLHEVDFDLIASDLAKRGEEKLELSLLIPMGQEGVTFEKEAGGLEVVMEFGLPSMLTWILKAVIAALLALLTPCVFPMIPVTMSFFTKQSEKEHSSPLKLPIVYVVGIVASFVLIGVIFTSLFAAAGPQFLATNGFLQGFFGILFVLFSLSLFGMFELRPPAFLMNKASGVQGKGGIGGTLGMGLLFSLTSFTCTAPLVGALLVDAAESDDWLMPVVGMFFFSLVLATPFFFLALFPNLMKSMPKSGGWLNSVKVTLGFLELAFALKFIGAMDAYFGWAIFTRTSILWMWVVIFIMNGCYLLGVVRFKDDMKLERVGGIAGSVAVSLIVLGLYTMTGAQGSQLPSLMESLMPPSLEESSDGGLMGWPNHISDDPEAAFARARELGVPVFVDFTGYT